ncbi:MAG: phosphodiester glycosidase family protein [Chloroflexales bacterium]|nr:phosphodiester glycosidase family protein [Chloroflexales bacterium]
MVPTLMPTLPGSPPSAPDSDDSGWRAAGTGIEVRRIRYPSETGTAALTVVRIDPQQVRFHVGYDPEQPRTLSLWQSETGALAAINGGFFDANNRSTALVISAWVASGESYQGRGGMFAVGAAGVVSLRYLAEQPYDPNEALVEAVQSWPMLISPGGGLAYTSEGGEQARRSVIARDRAGQVLLIACPTSTFTLRGMADWLLASDLEIDAALNLDGGSSTGLYLDSGGERERIDSFVLLPQVLLVLPK